MYLPPDLATSGDDWFAANGFAAAGGGINSGDSQKIALDGTTTTSQTGQLGASGGGDPARQAVLSAFAQKGIQPRDEADTQYWVDAINRTGGMGNAGNASYWTDRMANTTQGGVGDYQERPEAGSSSSTSQPGVNVTLPTAPTYTNFSYDQQPQGAFTPTSSYAPNAPFVAPTGVTEQNDPGYQFRAKQQQQALENSAAAKGMLRTNNTWQALQDQSGQLASQEYGNVYNRAANAYGINQTGQAQEYGQQANTYNTNQAGQQQGFNQAFNTNQANNSGQLGNYNAQVNALLGQGNLALGYQNSSNSYNLGQAQLANNQSQFNTNQGNWLNNNAFQQNYSVAQLGSPGAPNSQQYGVNQGSTLQNQGDVNASGQVGSANAWNGALGQIGSTAQQAAYQNWLLSGGNSGLPAPTNRPF